MHQATATKGSPVLRIILAAFLLTATVFGLNLGVCCTATAETATGGISVPKQSGEFSAVADEINASVEVDLYVEIPSQRLMFHHSVIVPVGYTVSQVLEAAYPVKHGLVCCDASDIWSVNGVPSDPATEKWWIIKVNGNKQNYSARSKVSNNDIVELIYEEGAGYPPGHVRLEDWVAGAKHGKN